MPKKIEIIIYDFKKKGEEKMSEEHKLRYLTGSDAKRILELADQEGVNVEDLLSSIKNSIKKEKGEIKMTDKTDDEKFTEEEKKVEKYLEDHKSENLTYRDAVMACLDSTEPKKAKEFSAEEIKEQENLKAVENYLDANPRSTYSEACRVLFKGQKPSLEEKLIEEYQKANPKATYKEAVIESLSLLRKREKEE